MKERRRNTGDNAEDIVRKLCKRIFREMNVRLADSLSCDDCPSSFTAVDRFCILYCEEGYTLDEINPHLEDYLDSCISSQLRKLSVSDYDYIEAELMYDDDSETPTDIEVSEYIFKAFFKMIDDHYYLQKIQTFLERF